MSCWKLHILFLVCLSWQLPVMNTLVRKAPVRNVLVTNPLVRNVLVMNTLVRKAVHDQEVVQKWVLILLKQGPALPPGCNYPVPLQLVLSLCCHWLVWRATLPSRSGVLRMQKLRSPLLRTQSYQMFSLKPGVGHNIQHISLHTQLQFGLSQYCLSGSFQHFSPRCKVAHAVIREWDVCLWCVALCSTLRWPSWLTRH